MRWAGNVERMAERRNLYRVLVGKPEGKRPLERPRRRWEYGIKMDVRLVGGRVWSGFTWLRIGFVGGLLCMRRWTFGFWRHGVKSVLIHTTGTQDHHSAVVAWRTAATWWSSVPAVEFKGNTGILASTSSKQSPLQRIRTTYCFRPFFGDKITTVA
jgi:hypothetical protein